MAEEDFRVLESHRPESEYQAAKSLDLSVPGNKEQ